MESNGNEVTASLREQLKAYAGQPVTRTAESTARGRAAFLVQAQAMKETIPAIPVPEEPVKRHKMWMHPKFIITFWKERSHMVQVIGTIVLIAAVLFGGVGATYAAAQNSLPEDSLYGVKLWSEDSRLELTNETSSQLTLSLKFADRRMMEIKTMLAAGEIPPEAVVTRYLAQIENAMMIAAGMDDIGLQAGILQIQTHLQQHDQEMLQLQLQAGTPGDQLKEQIRDRICIQLRLIGQCTGDPEQLREQLRLQQQENQPTDIPRQGTPNGDGYGPGPQPEVTPGAGDGYGPGPQPSVTPGAGGGYGPGPQPSITPGAGDGYGPGPGPNPSATCDGSGQGSGGNGNKP